MEKERVVLCPSVGVGHLMPMVELAKLFSRHNFSVTIIVINASEKSPPPIPSLDDPSISFYVLPYIQIPADFTPLQIMLEAPGMHNPNLLSFLKTFSSVRALVLDFFSTDVLDVASELRVPAYFFFTSGAFSLITALYHPYIHDTTTISMKDMGDTPLHFPGMFSVPACDIPQVMLDRSGSSYNSMMYHFRRLRYADGILVNTFDWAEEKTIKALKDGICLPNHATPPVYCIGPLLYEDKSKEGKERHECLIWLDTQPKRSVIFLCFGSLGSFSVEQLTETAIGLEKSGQRFLWVVRGPRGHPNSDLNSLLPEGFVDRTKDQGMVVHLWAPQVEVLKHESVGGFVTHCGWNSALEGIYSGLPLICWPLYAEQRLNKIFLVQELKVGVEMKGYDEELVNADEVEAKLRWLMESEGGKELRNRTAMVRDKAIEAMSEGGSSYRAFANFISGFKDGDRNGKF
ncbi:hypothetical protein LUZ60_000539 [Juncus effusus]|nr:hypothetical protein LUZ60_000539 [Juncus effusus]